MSAGLIITIVVVVVVVVIVALIAWAVGAYNNLVTLKIGRAAGRRSTCSSSSAPT